MAGTSLLSKAAGAFTGTGASAPILDGIDWFDPVQGSLLDAGSLILIDPTHSANPWASGVPAVNTALPNIAAARCLTVLGSVTASDAQVQLKQGGSSPSDFTLERSGKGGLHVAVSQTAAVANSSMYLRGSTALETYIFNNPTHRYGLWVTGRITRGGITQTNSPEFGSLTSTTTPRSNYILRPHLGGGLPAGSVTNLGASGYGVTGDFYRGVSAAGWTGTAPGAVSGFIGVLGFWGNGFGNTTNPLNSPSWILHRLYLADLTVGGRSFAQVDALFQAAYQAHHGSGGKYAGDTYTTPA